MRPLFNLATARHRVGWPTTVARLCRLAAALLVVMAMTSCASRRAAQQRAASAAESPKPAQSTAQIRAEEPRVGTVRVIGAHRRFVLVETPSVSAAATLPTGQLLHCRATTATVALSTADLRFTGERNQGFVAADVLAGNPQVGDLVFLAATEGETPAPGPGIPISSVLPLVAPLPTVPAPR